MKEYEQTNEMAELDTDKGIFYFWNTGRISCRVKDSTSIGYWAWQVDSSLIVQFVQNPEKSYRYVGVPYGVVVDLINAKSLGSFVAKQIKPNYEFQVLP